MFKVSHSVIYVAIITLPLVIDYFLKKQYRKRRDALKNQKEDCFYECKFLNMKNFNCKQHLIDKVECNYYCSYAHLKILRNFIATAKESINICMYTLTLQPIHVAILNAYERGVAVRIITDRVMLRTRISQFHFSNLQEKGIPYRLQPSDQSMMHHKFCLIDKDNPENARMCFGSTNLTTQAIVSNFDCYIFTNNKNIMKRYNEEFEELWESFR